MDEKKRKKQRAKKGKESKKEAHSAKKKAPKGVALTAAAKKALTLAEKKIADLRAWTQKVFNDIGIAVDTEFANVRQDLTLLRRDMRTGMQQHDRAILVLQRVFNDAVSGRKVRTFKTVVHGEQIDLINWTWYLEQLDGCLAAAKFIHFVAHPPKKRVEEPENSDAGKKEEPTDVAPPDGTETFGGDFETIEPPGPS